MINIVGLLLSAAFLLYEWSCNQVSIWSILFLWSNFVTLIYSIYKGQVTRYKNVIILFWFWFLNLASLKTLFTTTCQKHTFLKLILTVSVVFNFIVWTHDLLEHGWIQLDTRYIS